MSALYGTQPVYRQASPAFRLALDAAAALLGPHAAPLLRCDAPALAGELRSRFVAAPARPAGAAIWVEPRRVGWEDGLAALLAQLGPGAPLLLLLSQPAARLSLGPAGAGAAPLGRTPGGVGRLGAALRRGGLRLERRYGFQTPAALVLARLAALAEGTGRPDLADRLLAAARLRPPATGPGAALAAVALLVARTREA